MMPHSTCRFMYCFVRPTKYINCYSGIWNQYGNASRSFSCTKILQGERQQVQADTRAQSPGTGMCMPILALGTWKIQKAEQADKVLSAAFKTGYRAIDIAPNYGNEAIIGCALQKAMCEAKLKREDIFIINKLPVDAMQCDKVQETICKALQLLKTPYIDLYMFTFPGGTMKNSCGKTVPDPNTDLGAIWKGMEAMVEHKKIKYLGAANVNCEQLQELVKNATVKPSNIQMEFHAFMQQPEFREVISGLGMTVTGYAPFGRSPALNDWLKEKGFCGDDKPSLIGDKCIESIAKKLNKTPHQLLLRFYLQLDEALTIVAGASDPEKLCQNFQIFDFCIPTEDMCTLKSLDKNLRLFNKCIFQYILPGVDEHPLFPWKD